MVKISVCPKCKSPDIRVAQTIIGILPENWVCDKCGYEGYIVFEIDTEDEEKV